MRELILKMSISIDGFVSGPAGEADWIFRNADARSTAWTLDSVSHAGVHIMGSRTFATMAAHWPSSPHVFAAPMNQIPKVVFARHGRPETAAEGWRDARVASGELADEIARLKQEPGGPIIAHGGASFAQSLARSGLVDEYRLLVHPVALGRGLPLFSAVEAPLALELVDLQRFETGVVAHAFRRR